MRRGGQGRASVVALCCGVRLRRLRTMRGWTTRHLAQLTGYSQAYVSLVERGRVNARLGTLETFAAVLGVDVGTLLQGEAGPAVAVSGTSWPR